MDDKTVDAFIVGYSECLDDNVGIDISLPNREQIEMILQKKLLEISDERDKSLLRELSKGVGFKNPTKFEKRCFKCEMQLKVVNGNQGFFWYPECENCGHVNKKTNE